VEAARGTSQRERTSAWRLTPELGTVLLDTLGLEASIEWHLHRCRKVTGVPYDLAVNNAAGFGLSEDHAATIFDIYSEALNNVAQHAEADHIAVALTITPNEVTLVVRDNGLGLGEEASRSKAGGIAGMRARAQNHNGFCEFAGARNAGTTVKVSLPIRRAA
jgi:signal transduction histidine kinase